MTDLERLKEEWTDAICGDLEGFELVDQDIIDTFRNGTHEYAVVKSTSGKYYRAEFRVPSGDCCDSIRDQNDGGVDCQEVTPVGKIIKDWKLVEDKNEA